LWRPHSATDVWPIFSHVPQAEKLSQPAG